MDPLNKCTVYGEKWLAAALDPFHDTNLELAGMPDLNPGPSFVSVLSGTDVITAPAGATNSWGLAIGFLPVNNTCSSSYLIYSGGGGGAASALPVYGNLASPPSTNFVGPISAIAFNDSFLALGGSPTRYIGYQPNNIAGNIQYQFGNNTLSPGRVIGMAFEVTDITPTLYQQGSVTVWRQPYHHDPGFNFVAQNNTNVYSISSPADYSPVYNLPTAMAIPGSRTWDAKKGVYCVGHLADYSKCVSAGNTNGSIFTLQGTDYLAGGSGNNTGDITVLNTTGGHNGFALGGASFTGLNSSFGALRVTYRIIYEYFPRPTQSDPFISLSSPSAPFDACAFQHYAKAMAALPPGVPVSMNAAGDWFRMVLQAVNSSGIANMLHPLLGVGVNYVNSLVNRPPTMANNTRRRQRPRRRQQQVTEIIRVPPTSVRNRLPNPKRKAKRKIRS